LYLETSGKFSKSIDRRILNPESEDDVTRISAIFKRILANHIVIRGLKGFLEKLWENG